MSLLKQKKMFLLQWVFCVSLCTFLLEGSKASAAGLVSQKHCQPESQWKTAVKKRMLPAGEKKFYWEDYSLFLDEEMLLPS